jgi:hypothetical protein
MAKKQRRPQASKRERVQRVQELRRSNAAGAHANKNDYRRKPKHGDEFDWEDYDY